MGKTRVKPKVNAAKTAIREAKKAAKRAAREKSGAKKPHKGKSRSLAGLSIEGLTIKTPTQRATEALSHVKWPSLFKKHIGVLESHVKHLERVMQSVKDFMLGLSEEERGEWEKGEKGQLKIITGFLERARETLGNAKEAVSLLPGHRAVAAKMATTKAETKVDEDGDSEMEDVDTSSDEDVEKASESDSSSSSSKSDDEEVVKDEGAKPETNGAVAVEANPYFVIDTEPTPVAVIKSVPPPTTKKSKKDAKAEVKAEKKAKKTKKVAAVEEPPKEESASSLKHTEETTHAKDTDVAKSDKKRRKSEDSESKKTKKSKKEVKVTVTTSEPAVDFEALQAKLQAEVDIGEATKDVEAHGSSGESKKDKKRRRTSDGLSKEGKKSKKEEKEKKKRKAVEEEGEEVVASRKRKA
jgi:hypothetical protein